jgi:hypothetical protein
MATIVIVEFQIEGFHYYPTPPKKVEFLANKHRHSFIIKAGYKVKNLDREKEIFIEREYLKHYLTETYGSPCEFGPMSCEMIATKLLEYGAPEKMCWCEVWEENTGGARVEK